MSCLLFEIPENEYPTLGQPDSAVSMAEGRTLVAKDGEEVVGYIDWEYFGPDEKHFPNSVFLSGLWVEPSHRGRGLGRQLVAAALAAKHPPQFGYFSLTHSPDEGHLTRLYSSLGFSVVGTTDVGNVMMRKLARNFD